MTIGSHVKPLHEALTIALEELDRINAAHNCVRPDVTYTARMALKSCFFAPIEHAVAEEQLIAGQLIHDILDRDLLVSVWDGEDYAIRKSSDADAIFKAMASTDTDEIVIYRRDDPKRIGWVLLVWGNGVDLISNSTDNETTADILKGAQIVAEELSQ